MCSNLLLIKKWCIVLSPSSSSSSSSNTRPEHAGMPIQGSRIAWNPASECLNILFRCSGSNIAADCPNGGTLRIGDFCLNPGTHPPVEGTPVLLRPCHADITISDNSHFLFIPSEHRRYSGEVGIYAYYQFKDTSLYLHKKCSRIVGEINLSGKSSVSANWRCWWRFTHVSGISPVNTSNISEVRGASGERQEGPGDDIDLMKFYGLIWWNSTFLKRWNSTDTPRNKLIDTTSIR